MSILENLQHIITPTGVNWNSEKKFKKTKFPFFIIGSIYDRNKSVIILLMKTDIEEKPAHHYWRKV